MDKKWALKEIRHKKIVYYLGLSKLPKLFNNEKAVIENQNNRILNEIQELKEKYGVSKSEIDRLDKSVRQQLKKINVEV